MDLFGDLNDEQRRAVDAGGPLVITAGPGTGKTKTLTSKIVYLLQQGVPADDVLALTFTNKAGEEMKERVKRLNNQKKLPFIGTFHGLALKLLSDVRDVNIVSEEDQKEIVRSVLKDLKMKMRVRQAVSHISKHKSAGTADALVETYNEHLRARGLYDFDDLLLELLNTITLSEITRRWKYVLVDEFQDTNAVQYELVKKLAASENICVIGDPCQSIYAFRGSDPRIFAQFTKDFPNTQKVTLRANYRSGASIIEVASTLFPQAPRLDPQTVAEGQVRLITTLNEHTQARWILGEIGRQMGGMDLNEVGTAREKGARFSDFAVIYRIHDVGRQLELLFAENGIPYQVIGGAVPHQQSDIEHDKVVLLTMHAAKGLEFDHVFLAGFEEGLIPYTRRGESEDELAEERRLLYVALTRAKQHLYMLRPLYRRRQKTAPSRFEAVLESAALVHIEDAAIAVWHKKRAQEREKKRQLSLL